MANVNYININGKSVRVRKRRVRPANSEVPEEYIVSRCAPEPRRHAEKYKNNRGRAAVVAEQRRVRQAHSDRIANDPEYRARVEKETKEQEELKERGHRIYEARAAKAARKREDAVLPLDELERVRKKRKDVSDRLRRSEAWLATAECPPEYAMVMREFITRCLRGMMTPTAYTLMMFVCDRTLDWGKHKERITVRQFIGGSKTREDGTQAFCGMYLSETTLRVRIHNQ